MKIRTSFLRLAVIAVVGTLAATTGAVTAEAAAPTYSVFGRVLQEGPGGIELVPNASINAESAFPDLFEGPPTLFTDQDGHFELKVPAGRYFVSARPAWGDTGNRVRTYVGDVAFRSDAVAVDVPGAGFLDITLIQGGAISGTVGFDPSIAPAGRQVLAHLFVLNPTTGRLEDQITRYLASGGDFLLEGVPPGDAYIRFEWDRQPRAYDAAYWPGVDHLWQASPIEVEAGSVTTGVDITLEPHTPPEVVRIGGLDRFEMAVQVSRLGIPDELLADGVDGFAGGGVDAVFITNGLNFPDALSAGPVAAFWGPVLLVWPTSIPQSVRDELTRLKPQQIIIAGGPASVSNDVKAQLAAYTSGSVTRITGQDRYAVSRDMARLGFPGGADTVYVSTGDKFPDALGAGALGGATGSPVLLVPSGAGLDAETWEVLDELGARDIVIVGGPASVAPSFITGLAAKPIRSVQRISGQNRFEVSTSLGSANGGYDEVFIANGNGFADALAGSWLAGTWQAPIMLTEFDCAPETTAQMLGWFEPRTIYLLGGPGSVSPALEGYPLPSC